jgi:hypothetical protein
LIAQAGALLTCFLFVYVQDARRNATANLPTASSTAAISTGGASIDAAIEIPDVQSGADRCATPSAATNSKGTVVLSTAAGAGAAAGICCRPSTDVESCQTSDAGASTEGCRCCGRMCDSGSAEKSEVRRKSYGHGHVHGRALPVLLVIQQQTAAEGSRTVWLWHSIIW